MQIMYLHPTFLTISHSTTAATLKIMRVMAKLSSKQLQTESPPWELHRAPFNASLSWMRFAERENDGERGGKKSRKATEKQKGLRERKEGLLTDLTYLEHCCDPHTHQAAAMRSCSVFRMTYMLRYGSFACPQHQWVPVLLTSHVPSKKSHPDWR